MCACSARRSRIARARPRRCRVSAADTDALELIARTARRRGARSACWKSPCRYWRGRDARRSGTCRARREHRTPLYDKAARAPTTSRQRSSNRCAGATPTPRSTGSFACWTLRRVAFLLRRLIIFASEDGNADPRALSVAVDADAAFRRLGMPEGAFRWRTPVSYLASCSKSAAVKAAIAPRAREHRRAGRAPGAEEALERRHAPDALGRLRRRLSVPARPRGQLRPRRNVLPDEIAGSRFYQPTDQGLERTFASGSSGLKRRCDACRISGRSARTEALAESRTPRMDNVTHTLAGLPLIADAAVETLMPKGSCPIRPFDAPRALGRCHRQQLS